MSKRYAELARQLAAMLCDQDRVALAAAARAFLEGYGIRVTPLSIVPSSELCACDGVFFPHPIPNIAYAPTPGSRRESFTLVHEFGHYLVRRNDEVLSALHDLDDDAGRIAEERVCHAFAGQILIPDQVVAQVLDGRSPEAHHLRQLVAASSGSLEACAVRLAEHLPSNGYVVIADPVHRCIQFASPSPAAPYRWGRQTHLPEQHPLWRAAATGRFRGQGQVVWTSGSRMNLWLDAVADHGLVHAIFSQTRYWGGAGLSLLDEAPATARPIAISGTCRHCGEATWGMWPAQTAATYGAGPAAVAAAARPSRPLASAPSVGLTRARRSSEPRPQRSAATANEPQQRPSLEALRDASPAAVTRRRPR